MTQKCVYIVPSTELWAFTSKSNNSINVSFQRRCRLLYKFIENRSFHIALLKYMHLLTNRACHRTALEIAKVLLNLDPSDPLAVILVIDILALRSREHKWLHQVVEYWNWNRDGEFMFNLQYSQAMCCYHLSKGKNNEGKCLFKFFSLKNNTYFWIVQQVALLLDAVIILDIA